MAYIRADGSGPVLNKRGEWLTNVHRDAVTKTQREEWASPARCYVDDPHSVPGGYSVTRLKAHGIVGLYLGRDEPMPPGATEVPTPPELLEPEASKGATHEP